MIVVTGPTGNVGSYVVESLLASHARTRCAMRLTSPADVPQSLRHVECVHFDFLEPATFLPALKGAQKLFLVRPPAIADVKGCFAPLIRAAQEARVAHIVFLSLLGAEKISVTPHHKIEALIRASGVGYTFLRCSFFMQNLSTTHAPEIRDLNEIIVPAGKGETSFIDVRDIGEVAALVLTQQGHHNRCYDLTGDKALSYGEVAAILSQTLGRTIHYRNPSLLTFVRQMLRRGYSWSHIAIMVGIYSTARFGLAGRTAPDVSHLLGRSPRTFAEFARDHRECWLPRGST